MKVKFDFRELEDFKKRLSSNKKLSNHFKEVTRELAAALKKMLIENTPEVSGDLKRGWEGFTGDEDSPNVMSYNIRTSKNGYSVTLYNRMEYANAVNYGHHSYNQYGGPYVVDDKNRTVQYIRGGSGATFVYGRFFVELTLEEFQKNPKLIYDIMGTELVKWWEWCVNGK